MYSSEAAVPRVRTLGGQGQLHIITATATSRPQHCIQHNTHSTNQLQPPPYLIMNSASSGS